MNDEEKIAPVIPLFGAEPTTSETVGHDAEIIVPQRTGEAGLWRSTWDAPEAGSDAGTPSERHPALGRGAVPRLRALAPTGSDNEQDDSAERLDAEEVRTGAEELLVRKLRTRSLSVSEARMVLKGYEVGVQRLDAALIDDVIDDFCRRGYLDDAILAGHLVTSGVQRKGQGRVALSRALAQRGIPREVIDAALDEVPDDDLERALEYARSKMRSLGRLDPETAKRRLSGQLARRGYPGGVVSSVVRTVIGEQFTRSRPSGVRFE